MKTFTKNVLPEAERERLHKRNGFTLVELLTVIAIIGMLGAVSLSAVRGAVQTAKETQTRTTIAKIDNVLTGIYEKYQYRRVETTGDTPMVRAYNRVLKIRDLLRCDMPCTYEELARDSEYNRDSNSVVTPLQDVYQKEVARAGADANSPNINAELLYLVVMNADPEARSTFTEREVDDTDGNGLLEFIDGWGNPIRWMRWAPGLILSDRQPLCYDGLVTPADPATASVDKADADPFDPLDVIQMAIENTTPTPAEQPGWFLVPYVYSAGPDEEYGLIPPEYIESLDTSFVNDPFTYSRSNPDETAGAPGEFDENGLLINSKKYTDNIDNHTLVR